MKRHPLYHFSPCILLSIVVLVKIVISYQAIFAFISWRFYTPVIQMFAALLIPVMVDWPVKKITKGNVIYIWIIEAILIVIGMYFFPELWVTFFGGMAR
jgi:hypothetical protein